jgi:hypothetical protein
MTIQKKKKYPLNHTAAEAPVATQAEHASLSDGQSDELLEIKDAIARVFGVTATIIESKEDESKDNIGEGQRLAKRPVYAGPEDLVFGNDPVFGGQKAPEDSDTSHDQSEDEQLVIFH